MSIDTLFGKSSGNLGNHLSRALFSTWVLSCFQWFSCLSLFCISHSLKCYVSPMPVAFCSSAVATCNMAPSVATGQIHIDARQVHVLLQMHACIHASCQTSLAGGVQWTPHVTSDGFAQVFGKANHFVKQTRRAWPGTHIHYCTFMCLDLRTGALKPVTSRLFFLVSCMLGGRQTVSCMSMQVSLLMPFLAAFGWLDTSISGGVGNGIFRAGVCACNHLGQSRWAQSPWR